MFPFGSLDKFTTRLYAHWQRKYLGRPYSETEPTFMCAHPFVYLANEVLQANLVSKNDYTSPYLADWWFRLCESAPSRSEQLVFRFQSDANDPGTLRPNKIVHMGMITERVDGDNGTQGYMVEVHPGSTFVPKFFGEGIVGDGFYDPNARWGIHIKYLPVDKLFRMSNS